jgi:hypothetical protein
MTDKQDENKGMVPGGGLRDFFCFKRLSAGGTHLHLTTDQWLASGRVPLFLILAIIAIGLAGRALNPVFVNDQLELLEFSARWQWVYDEQMPVYAWISTALLRLTGDSVLALDALKYLWVGGMLMALAGIRAVAAGIRHHRDRVCLPATDGERRSDGRGLPYGSDDVRRRGIGLADRARD